MRKIMKGFTMLELMVCIAIIAILSSMSIPSFMKLQARAKQAEAMTNLRSLYSMQKAYLQEFSVYSTNVAVVGFSPERGNRYRYYLSTFGGLEDRSGTQATNTVGAVGIEVDVFRFGAPGVVGVSQGSTPCSTVALTPGPAGASFLAAAQGNIDDDPTIDVWTIASFSRSMVACADVGANIVAGVPANDVNDVVE
jgi:type IV pilus assembly protein PilA